MRIVDRFDRLLGYERSLGIDQNMRDYRIGLVVSSE